MILKNLITQLRNGDLFNSSIGLGNDLTDEDNAYNIIVSHLNLALVSLHTKLHLKEGSLKIIQDEAINTYYMKKQFAVSNTTSTEPIKYIDDSGSPYIGDCIKITSMIDSAGEQILLNDLSAVSPIWLNAPNAFKVKTPITGNVLTVNYRATHEILDINSLDPAITEVDIPFFAIEALGYFIASRVYSSFPSVNEGTNMGIEYLNKYERAILELSNAGITSIETHEYDKAGARGWV